MNRFTFLKKFRACLEQYREQDGKQFAVLSYISHADNGCSSVCLGMFKVRFTDGTEITAAPEEIVATVDGVPFTYSPLYMFALETANYA